MSSVLLRVTSALILTCLLLVTTREARANIAYAPDSKAIPVIVGVVAVAAGIVFVSYLLLRTPRTTGCVVATSNGLALDSERSDHAVYALENAGDRFKPGERIRIVGKRRGVPGKRTILVTRLSKDYGACRVSPAA